MSADFVQRIRALLVGILIAGQQCTNAVWAQGAALLEKEETPQDIGVPETEGTPSPDEAEPEPVDPVAEDESISNLSEDVPEAPGVSCNPSGPGHVMRIAPQAIRYCGLLDADGLARFRSALDDEVTDLVITSAGGSLDYPLRMARIVRERSLAVEIVGPCFSGCASFVFIASTRRTLSPTAVLGFHQTASSSALLSARVPGGHPGGLTQPLYHRSQQEVALYSSSAVDLDLLYAPQVLIDTICVIPPRFDATAGESVIRIVSDHQLWIPTGRQLDRFGVTYKGSLSKSRADAERRFRLYMPDDVGVPEFAFGALSASISPFPSLYRVPSCDAAEGELAGPAPQISEP